MDQKETYKQIPTSKLEKYIGKSVIYKISDGNYKRGVLGSQIPGTDYYQLYTDTEDDKHQGICCSGDKLYKKISGENKEKKK
jgi:hypothetical protein